MAHSIHPLMHVEETVEEARTAPTMISIAPDNRRQRPEHGSRCCPSFDIFDKQPREYRESMFHQTNYEWFGLDPKGIVIVQGSECIWTREVPGWQCIQSVLNTIIRRRPSGCPH